MSEIQENNNRELEIGVSDLFFALNTMPILNEATENLIKAISSAEDTIASLGGNEEYTSVELLSTDTSLSNKNITEEENIITKLSNTKRLLISFDADAMHFFKFTDAGYIDIDEEGNMFYVKAPEYAQDFYIHDDYAGSTVAKRGCGLCSMCTSSSSLLNIFMAPGYLSSLVTSSNTSNGILDAAHMSGLDIFYGDIKHLAKGESGFPDSDLLSEKMSFEEALPILIGAGYSVTIQYKLSDGHFMCVPASAGDGKYYLVDSYSNKENISGVRTGEYTAENINKGDFNNQSHPLDKHSTIFVCKPSAEVGTADLAHTTISITKDLADEIYTANNTYVDGSDIIETLDLPETELYAAYEQAVDEFNNQTRI
jgi:hypothetical protein